EPSRNPSRELDDPGSNSIGVRFDRDSGKLGDERRDSRPVFLRNRPLVEEIARVVKLDPIRPRTVQSFDDLAKLSGQRPGRRRTIDRPPPQIAERTCVSNIAASEKNR